MIQDRYTSRIGIIKERLEQRIKRTRTLITCSDEIGKNAKTILRESYLIIGYSFD